MKNQRLKDIRLLLSKLAKKKASEEDMERTVKYLLKAFEGKELIEIGSFFYNLSIFVNKPEINEKALKSLSLISKQASVVVPYFRNSAQSANELAQVESFFDLVRREIIFQENARLNFEGRPSEYRNDEALYSAYEILRSSLSSVTPFGITYSKKTIFEKHSTKMRASAIKLITIILDLTGNEISENALAKRIRKVEGKEVYPTAERHKRKD